VDDSSYRVVAFYGGFVGYVMIDGFQKERYLLFSGGVCGT